MMNTSDSMIDRCPNNCGGRIRIVSLSRDERIRRRCGQAMIGRCTACGSECQVNKRAWAKFARQQRDTRSDHRQAQPTLFAL